MRKKLIELTLFGLFLKLKSGSFLCSIFWGAVITVFATWYAEGIPDLSLQTAAGFIGVWVVSVSFVFFLLSQGSYQQPSGRFGEEQTEETQVISPTKIEHTQAWKPDLPDFLPIDRVDELVKRAWERDPIEDR